VAEKCLWTHHLYRSCGINKFSEHTHIYSRFPSPHRTPSSASVLYVGRFAPSPPPHSLSLAVVRPSHANSNSRTDIDLPNWVCKVECNRLYTLITRPYTSVYVTRHFARKVQIFLLLCVRVFGISFLSGAGKLLHFNFLWSFRPKRLTLDDGCGIKYLERKTLHKRARHKGRSELPPVFWQTTSALAISCLRLEFVSYSNLWLLITFGYVFYVVGWFYIIHILECFCFFSQFVAEFLISRLVSNLPDKLLLQQLYMLFSSSSVRVYMFTTHLDRVRVDPLLGQHIERRKVEAPRKDAIRSWCCSAMPNRKEKQSYWMLILTKSTCNNNNQTR
jgi:hypothetical protein